ncbi:MAG: flagellar hook-associated protein FlgK [Bryobacterales bacterium]|nr:flagellar hook-associated protein FlgK [Bryobacterales bacterium]
MGGLFSALITTTGAMRANDRVLMTIQNNVSNASTPGYARRQLSLYPRHFDVRLGLAGGVATGELINYRNEFSERNVWRQSSNHGRYAEQRPILEEVESTFSIADGAGIPGALNRFFNGVSSWAVNPNDPVARQVVLDRAASVARSFNSTAKSIAAAATTAERQIASTVDRINSIVGRVREINLEMRTDRQKVDDPGLDAQLYASLEELSELVDFNVLKAEDGTMQILLGGQTPLVIGDRQYEIRADFSFGTPRILNAQEADITAQVGNGGLAGLLETRNQQIPTYLDDLNRMASTFADRVNQVLAGGLDANGSSPLVDLFTYDPVLGAAATLTTNPLEPWQLAGAETTAPGGNGNALLLASLSESAELDGGSFHTFYGELGAKLGRDLQNANDGMQIQEELLSQSKELRAERSGVSLDEEAARLVEAQRAYQANAQLFQVLNELTDVLINLLR